MSLRLKLTLFTVSFVLLVSLAILSASVVQIRQKEKRDIETLRTNELKRMQNNLQSSVNLICSAVEDRMGSPEMPVNLSGIIKKLKKSTITSNTDWIWLLDTGTTIQPFYLSDPIQLYQSFSGDIHSLFQSARDSGFSIFESSMPAAEISDSLSSKTSHLYWYAQSITPGGWVLAAGAPLGNLDSIVEKRTLAVETEITRMVKDRMLFSFLLIAASAVAIIIFSKIISNPVNRFVILTESIAEGRKGFTEKIKISSKDEIGRLAANFNAMLDHIQSSMNKLEEAAEKYRELVESANSAIIHLDARGVVLFVNEYAQNLFGYLPSEVVGRDISETIGKDIGDRQDGNDMFHSPEKYPYLEREHVTSNGNRIWVGWSNHSFLDNEQNKKETLCVGSDITKSKEAEELAVLQQRKLIQADKMATLGILVSGMAHEINNPNNYIILNAQAFQAMWQDMEPVLESFAKDNPDYAVHGLAYSELKKEIPGMLNGIANGALRIKHIVQNLKDFSRMEPDDMSQKIEIAKVLEAAQVILSNMIKKSTNELRIKIDPDVPSIRGNFQRIEQVIINLLTNACQANDDRNKPICAEVKHNKINNEIIVIVTDQGPGINDSNMKRIFDPFFTTKRTEGGTGLGLAVSYSIVKDHGGDLRLESAEGKGTSAILTLPVI
jgi:PAS domain S-box-containing protein